MDPLDPDELEAVNAIASKLTPSEIEGLVKFIFREMIASELPQNFWRDFWKDKKDGTVRVTIRLPGDYSDLIKEIQEAFDEPVDLARYIVNSTNSVIEGDISSIHSDDWEKANAMIRKFHLENMLGNLLKLPDPSECERRRDERDREIVKEVLLEMGSTPEGREQVRRVFANLGIEEKNPQETSP